MKKILFSAALIAIFTGCSDNAATSERINGFTHELKNQEDSLMQEVMDGHDAAMAKMGKLAAYRKVAVKKIDSLVKAKSADLQQTGSYKKLADGLKSAEDEMNEWMGSFSIDSAKNDKQRRIAYLRSEKSKVTKVKEEILGIISRADSLFRK